MPAVVDERFSLYESVSEVPAAETVADENVGAVTSGVYRTMTTPEPPSAPNRDVPPPPPPCERPDGLIEDVFFTGYNIISPPSNVNSTVSVVAACNAVAYLNTFGGSYVNVVPTFLSIDYQGLYLGSQVFITNGTNDCTTIPDGWYFTGASQSVNTVFQVVGGLIVFINNCITTTTTTTSAP